MEQDGSTSLQFTGERFHPELEGEIRQEHMHRYAWCRDLALDKDVVDVASGEGFGSAMIAQQAASVIGLDVSSAAIDHATRRYARSNLQFKVGDAAAIDLPDASADIVISFETIEHIDNQESAISEFSRILREDGVLVISSPNVDTYSTRQDYDNPFHTKELNRQDFLDLLKKHFGAVEVFGQRMLVTSALLPSFATMDNAEVLVDDGEIRQVTRESPESMYFIAVAAREPRFLPSRRASFLLSEKYDVYWQQRDTIAQYQTELARTLADLTHFKNEVVRLRNEVIALRRTAGLENQLKHSSIIKKSGLFDPRFYSAQRSGAKLHSWQLLEDYIVNGETVGLAPSPDFDPVFYAATYPDVEESGMGLLLHYVIAGKNEGRLGKAP